MRIPGAELVGARAAVMAAAVRPVAVARLADPGFPVERWVVVRGAGAELRVAIGYWIIINFKPLLCKP